MSFAWSLGGRRRQTVAVGVGWRGRRGRETRSFSSTARMNFARDAAAEVKKANCLIVRACAHPWWESCACRGWRRHATGGMQREDAGVGGGDREELGFASCGAVAVDVCFGGALVCGRLLDTGWHTRHSHHTPTAEHSHPAQALDSPSPLPQWNRVLLRSHPGFFKFKFKFQILNLEFQISIFKFEFSSSNSSAVQQPNYGRHTAETEHCAAASTQNLHPSAHGRPSRRHSRGRGHSRSAGRARPCRRVVARAQTIRRAPPSPRQLESQPKCHPPPILLPLPHAARGRLPGPRARPGLTVVVRQRRARRLAGHGRERRHGQRHAGRRARGARVRAHCDSRRVGEQVGAARGERGGRGRQADRAAD